MNSSRLTFLWISTFLFLFFGADLASQTVFSADFSTEAVSVSEKFSTDSVSSATAQTSTFDELLEQLTDTELFYELELGGSVSLLDFTKVRSTSRDKFENGVLQLPYASVRSVNRFCFDCPISLNAQSSTFCLNVEYVNPEAVRTVACYFASGDGWYSMPPRAERISKNKFRYTFSLANARIEGEPAGPENVKGLRFAFYAGKEIDTSVTLKDFRVLKKDVLILREDGSESKESDTYANQFEAFLRSNGLSGAHIQENELTKDVLAEFPICVLPIVHKLSSQTQDLLCEYAKNGGFLVVCYGAPAQILETLGFRQTGYVRCKDRGLDLTGMTLEKEFPGSEGCAPEFIEQSSWNFVVGETLKQIQDAELRKTENRPRIIGYWTDKTRGKTAWPSMLWSSRGLWVTHILNSEGREAKCKFLSILLNQKEPNFLSGKLRLLWKDLIQVGMHPRDDFRQKIRETAAWSLEKLQEKGFTAESIRQLLFEGTAGTEGFTLMAELENLTFEARKMHCQKQNSVPGERRFIWEHSGFGTYPGDWDRTMKELADAGFTGLLCNQCWGGEARYVSDLLPISPRVKEYGDQVQQAVEAGKKYGIELHVWKVNFNCQYSSSEFLEKMRAEGRLQRDRNGVEEKWLCPSDPRNKDLEVESLKEIVQKYDVKGIHFDYIRFPDASHCFCDGCRKRFSEYFSGKTGKELENWPTCTNDAKSEAGKLWKEWRRNQISEVVQRTYTEVKKIRPSVEVSAAVFRDYPNCADSVGQDWILWAKNGWVDFLCPMNYTNSSEVFGAMTKSQKEYLGGSVPFYPGIGISSSSSTLPPDQCVNQIQIAREHGTNGWTIFTLSLYPSSRPF